MVTMAMAAIQFAERLFRCGFDKFGGGEGDEQSASPAKRDLATF